MIKAVIFDLDGVIADTEHLSARADDISLAKHGIAMTQDEKHRAFGRRMEEIYADMLQARNIKMDIKQLVREKDEVFVRLIKGNMKPIKNSLELVGFLKKHGFKLALATSSHEEKMMPELRELGIEDLFETRVSGDDVSRGKPDPAMFLEAAKRLGVRPEDCAVIEDSAFGVQAAKNAGMYAIALRSPNSPGQDLSPADMMVDDLAEVEEHISDLTSRK